ncbi:hypothetical protein [Pseudosulfitobacter pseudonitzschiae]|uniref:Uncharacterized protein n=1 Tax=Pseudosulfitobacter pseudonitzschiae TaxID=1402135 RepID=A0A221K615_9RHOB|nr:hypothetical protein SULPSESMR1_04741 [Pseudosulfitobacter pseudonitzschiae]
MTEAERTKLLETALIKYVELYGLTEEARVCFEISSKPAQRTALQVFCEFVWRCGPP